MYEYWRDLLRLPSGVRRFLATEALYGIAIGMYALVLNLHLLSKGLKETQVGTLASTGILIMGLLAIPVALLADRLGRKRLLVGGIAFIAAGQFCFAQSSGMAAFFAAQALVSVGLTLVETTEVQLLFHYCRSRKEETRAFSLMFAVFTAFTGVGTLIAGRLSDAFDGGGAYRMPLLLAGVVLLVHCVARGVWLPAERRVAATGLKAVSVPLDAEAESEAIKTRVGSAARDAQGAAASLAVPAGVGDRRIEPSVRRRKFAGARIEAASPAAPAGDGGGRVEPSVRRPKVPGARLWLFSLLLALIGGALAMTGSFLNVIVKYRLDWTDGRVSLLLAAAGFVLFVSSLLTPYVSERFGSNAAIVSAFAVNTVLFAVLFVAMPAWIFSVLLLLRGGASTMLSNLVDSRLMSAFVERDRNLFAGMRAVFRSIGSAGASYGTGFILAGEDYRTPFLWTAVFLGAAWFFYWRWVRPTLNA